MRQAGREMPLPIAFALAALLHAVVVVAILPNIMISSAGAEHLNVALPPDAILPPDDPERMLALGIDADTPSSLTWIGYDTFLEHLAQLSTVEQAEFEDDPGAMAGTDMPHSVASSAAAAEEADSPDPVEPVELVVAEPVLEPVSEPVPVWAAEESSTTSPPPPVLTDESDDRPSPIDALEPVDMEAGVGVTPDVEPALEGPAAPEATADEGTVVRPLRDDEIIELAAGMLPGVQQLSLRPRPRAESVDDPDEPQHEPQSAGPEAAPEMPSTTAAPAADGATDSVPASPSPRRPERTAGGARDGSGAESDRESTATSTVEVPLSDLRAGRPVAAHGMELMTRNPVFPILTSVTAAPRNPLVEIRFAANGRPRHARLLESSGDSRVDGPIVDSLFRWRARGGALDDLDPDDEDATVLVRMRIILRSR